MSKECGGSCQSIVGNASEAGSVVAGGTTTTFLDVPAMCCTAEFGLVEKHLRQVTGVRDVTADFLRRSVRVDHAFVPGADLLAAANRSGMTAALANKPEVAPLPVSLDSAGLARPLGAVERSTVVV
ncbi:MAG: hypothetical protein EOO77_33495, partial [Oxalobacteraceae bacterium]